jgi:hypothetical protein
MQLIWYPANSGTPITFSRDATDYKLLKNVKGFSYVDVDRITTDKAPGQHGTVGLDDLFSERTVTFDIMIQSATLEAQQALIQTLSSSLNPTLGAGTLKRINEDSTEYNLYCKPDMPQVSTDGTFGIVTAQLKFTAQDPFIYSGMPNIIYLDPNPTEFFAFDFPFSLASGTATGTAMNEGQVETPAIITIYGPITNPVINVTRLVNSVSTTDTLSLTMTLVAGDSVVINTDPDVMTATYYPVGGGNSNAMKYVDVGSDFWSLNVGANSVNVTKTTSSTGSTITVQWSDQYIGI